MRFWAGWAVILSGAISLTALVASHEEPSLKLDLIRPLQSSPVPGTTASNVVRALTNTEQDLVVGAVLAALLWRSGSRRAALFFAVLLVALPFAQDGLKLLVDRPRPPYDLEALWSEPGSPSYPSGHVMSASVVYGWLLYSACYEPWQMLLRIMSGALAAAALLMTAVTSLYLAVHWPSDVVGGYLWGLAMVMPAVWLARRSKIGVGCPSGLRWTRSRKRPP